MLYNIFSYTKKSSHHTDNEDSHFFCDDYIIVADGMGGESDGDIASRLAVDSINSFLSQNIPVIFSEKEINGLLSEAVYKADAKISDYIEGNPDSFGMGTTILVAIRKNDDLFIAWCGDSHCYTYKEREVVSITKDHSYVQQLIDSGHLTIEESFNHPNNNLITRFVGGGKETCIPDFCKHHVSDSELIIFCSDGLSGYCKTEDIRKTIRKNQNIQDLPKQLADLAISRGSEDDITIIILAPQSYVAKDTTNPLVRWFRKLVCLPALFTGIYLSPLCMGRAFRGGSFLRC